MRTALWHHLMRSEAAVRKVPGMGTGEPIVADLDADSRIEVLLTAPWGAAVVAPSEGVLVELDDWSIGANLLAVASRHREAYHLADESPRSKRRGRRRNGREPRTRSEVDARSLTFDDRRLRSLIDLIDGAELTERFEWTTDATSVTCTTESRDLRITKTFEARTDGLACTIRVMNTGPSTFLGSYGSETSALPLNLGRDTTKDLFEHDNDGWSLTQPEGEVGLRVLVEPACALTAEPIETASASLEGLQTMFQGTIVTATWGLELSPRATFEVRQVLVPRPQPENLNKKEPGVSA